MRIYSIMIAFIVFSLYINAQTNLENTNDDLAPPLNTALTNNINENIIIITPITNYNINPLAKIVNTNSGLFIDFSVLGKYNPVNLGFDFKIFYRFKMIKSENPIFKGNHLDIGIENIFRAGYNMIGAYAKVVPFIFMELDVKSYYNISYNGLDSGYIGLNDKNEDTSPSFIEETKGGNASGYFLSIAPTFKVIFNENIEIANRTEINFLSQGTYPYYFNRNNHVVHAKNDIEILNEISILTYITPIKVGPSYSILYVKGTDILTQSVDLNLDFDKYFLSNRLKLYFYLKAGFYIVKPYYANSTFISAFLGVQYQIL